MEILNKLGFKPEEIDEVNNKFKELGISDDARNYINSIGNKIEKASYSGGYSNAMNIVETEASRLFGIQKEDKEQKATDFIAFGLSKKLEAEKQELSNKIADYELQLKNKGFNTEEIEQKVAEKYEGKISALSTEVEKYQKELTEFKQKQIFSENKSTISKYLLPLSDEKDELAVRELNRFVEEILNSSTEITEINGEAYFKNSMGQQVSIKQAQAEDKFLSRFLKKETELNGEKGKLRINVDNSGSGYTRFNHLEGQEKINAIQEFLKKDARFSRNAVEFKKEFAKYMQ